MQATMFQKSVNPAMLRLAREARGMTQKELADLLEVEQGTLSKFETGYQVPSDHLLSQIASYLRFPLAFFSNPKQSFSSPTIYYRKLKQIPKRDLYKAEAYMDLCRFGLEELLRSVDIPDANLLKWDVEKHGSPCDAARELRKRWQVPKGPIQNLVMLLERNGIVVFMLDLAHQISGLSHIIGRIQPIIFLNANLSADRMRFTLAHELAHLVMHFTEEPIPKDRLVEDEAHQFAGEFLVPELEVAPYFIKLDLKRLLELKRYWKVSMQMLMYHAKRLNCINERQYRSLLMKIGQEGYRINEPIVFGKEEPLIAKKIVEMHFQMGHTEDSLVDLLQLPKDFLSLFIPEQEAVVPRMRIAF
jgi:Zn-dependent peptidase ImmA (M78 family)/DNA-binding XRE family transcriptional regulator